LHSSGLTIEWANLTCELKAKGEEKRDILSKAVGTATPGRMLAIMGPSGCGKTTLLSALAGQMPQSDAITLKGTILVDGKPLKKGVGFSLAFVPQEDVFYSQLTVIETLRMAASFQLPEGMADEKKEERVQQVIKALSLSKCVNTIVGDNKTRGISGGEKKRLSIGLELLSDPSVIIADEPTTGLDSFQAEKVMKVLRQLAQSGRTVICTIHQPKSSTFALFDDIVLLSEGLTIYSGQVNDAESHFLQAAGLSCPNNCNLAEFFLDCISIDTDTAEQEELSRKRVDTLVKAYSKEASDKIEGIVARKKNVSGDGKNYASRPQRCGWWKQVKLLYFRSFRQVFRDKATNMIRITTNVNSALVFGSIYWRLKRTQSTIQDRMGLLQVSAINTAMSSITKTLTAFSRERVIVNRERTKQNYTAGPYLLAKLAAELPISAIFPILFGSVAYPMCGLNKNLTSFAKFLGLVTVESFTSSAIGLSVGSLVSSPEAANALGPAVMVIFIVFGGYYCYEDNVPRAFRWIPRVSLIKHAFEGLAVNEFTGLKFEANGPFDVADGKAALERIGFGDSTVAKSFTGLGRIMLFNYMVTYIILKEKKPKFQNLNEE
jgi:ABC-type multidrug transport system ATPase subunit